MDEETLRALIRGIVAEELSRLGVVAVPRNRLSMAQLEQRRAAAATSKARRIKKEERAEKLRVRKQVKESIGSDGSVHGTNGSGNPTAERLLSDAPQQMHPATAVWLRYSTAFKVRYGAFPPRNARANSLISQLLKLIPAGVAPDVAEFYVKTVDPLYAKANHPLQLLVRDAEKLVVMAETQRTQAEAPPPQPWWKVWSGVQAQGKQLGIDETAYDNPTRFKNDVLRAAAAWGSLPREAQIELGMLPREG